LAQFGKTAQPLTQQQRIDQLELRIRCPGQDLLIDRLPKRD
jgi:hypothetical protein